MNKEEKIEKIERAIAKIQSDLEDIKNERPLITRTRGDPSVTIE